MHDQSTCSCGQVKHTWSLKAKHGVITSAKEGGQGCVGEAHKEEETGRASRIKGGRESPSGPLNNFRKISFHLSPNNCPILSLSLWLHPPPLCMLSVLFCLERDKLPLSYFIIHYTLSLFGILECFLCCLYISFRHYVPPPTVRGDSI